MSTKEQPTIRAAKDPMGELVLSVRGDRNSNTPDYELPPAVQLDQASEVLGLDAADGRALAKIDGYPVPVINLRKDEYQVGTAFLIRAAGLGKVRQALRVTG
ncbi:hypothetical protein ACWEQ8_30000 [Streptomyces noursei]